MPERLLRPQGREDRQQAVGVEVIVGDDRYPLEPGRAAGIARQLQGHFGGGVGLQVRGRAVAGPVTEVQPALDDTIHAQERNGVETFVVVREDHAAPGDILRQGRAD